MKIDIEFNSGAQLPMAAIPDLARLAEEHGFDCAWGGEANNKDPTVMLSAIAAVTTRLKIGSAIYHILGRTPATLALQAAGLDELPQIINILRGDMSIVGPRPERPEHIKRLTEKIPFYRTRLVIRPGLTGWAQVRYNYGSTDEDALIKLQYDLYYIRHQSLLLDLNIILRTVGKVLRMSGV